MNDQYVGKQYNPSDIVEGTYKDTTSPGVNSDGFINRVPVDATLIHETPMSESVVAVGPTNWPLADEPPVYETPVQVIQMGSPVAPVSPLEETIVQEAPLDETVPYTAPGVETITDEPLVSQPIPYQAPVGETISHETPIVTSATPPAALLNREESEHFRSRWNEIQGKFVDEPRSAVQQADALVSEVVEQITQMFAKEHSSLEGQWKQGEEVSTEDLRKALQHYRSFFNRLVV
jgi:hypothetical protein